MAGRMAPIEAMRQGVSPRFIKSGGDAGEERQGRVFFFVNKKEATKTFLI
jgi:hypothetical protein